MRTLYSNRRGMAGVARNILGTAKQGIKLLGRTNEFVNRLGVSSPQLNNLTANAERYADPTIDFADSEIAKV
jgi:hypothetical protein